MKDAGPIDFYQDSNGAQALSIGGIWRAADVALQPVKVNGMTAANPLDVFEDGRIVSRELKNLAHGTLAPGYVHAIVLHRTDGANAESTLSAYENKAEGAHFGSQG